MPIKDLVVSLALAAALLSGSLLPAQQPVTSQEPVNSIPSGSKVFVTPMDGFELYLVAALDKKKVPLIVVNDKEKADFVITGTAESQQAGWAKILVSGSAQSTEEASISVANTKTGELVFAYAVNKGSSVHGKQSTAEACAKHLKAKIEAK